MMRIPKSFVTLRALMILIIELFDRRRDNLRFKWFHKKKLEFSTTEASIWNLHNQQLWNETLRRQRHSFNWLEFA
jgi:hypothetical protein